MYRISFRGEIAYLKPDASKQINLKATTIYVDDFEGSQSIMADTITFGLVYLQHQKVMEIVNI
jgi:hypothetical protein